MMPPPWCAKPVSVHNYTNSQLHHRLRAHGRVLRIFCRLLRRRTPFLQKVKCGVCGVDRRSRKRAFVFELAFPKNLRKMVLSYASANFCAPVKLHVTAEPKLDPTWSCLWHVNFVRTSPCRRSALSKHGAMLAPRTLAGSLCTADTCAGRSCWITHISDTLHVQEPRFAPAAVTRCSVVLRQGVPGERGLQNDDMPRMALRHCVQLLARADQMHMARVPLRRTGGLSPFDVAVTSNSMVHGLE